MNTSRRRVGAGVRWFSIRSNKHCHWLRRRPNLAPIQIGRFEAPTVPALLKYLTISVFIEAIKSRLTACYGIL